MPQSGRLSLLKQSTAKIEKDHAYILTYALNAGVPIEYEPFDEDMELDWDVSDDEEE
jgi:hypothetical protein